MGAEHQPHPQHLRPSQPLVEPLSDGPTEAAHGWGDPVTRPSGRRPLRANAPLCARRRDTISTADDQSDDIMGRSAQAAPCDVSGSTHDFRRTDGLPLRLGSVAALELRAFTTSRYDFLYNRI